MPREIGPRELARRLAAGERVLLLDVRQPWESEIASLPGSLLIPLPELPAELEQIERDPARPIVAYCHHGLRSLSAAALLEDAGHGMVFSLAGGIDAWSAEVDPGVPTY